MPLIGLRVDRLDSAAACWKLRKQILFSFEFGRRQTTGLDFDFYCSNSCLQTRKGDPTRKWWRRPLSKASHFRVWGVTFIFLDYPFVHSHPQKTKSTRENSIKTFPFSKILKHAYIYFFCFHLRMGQHSHGKEGANWFGETRMNMRVPHLRGVSLRCWHRFNMIQQEEEDIPKDFAITKPPVHSE